jgi:hypothetical protein
MFKSSLFSYTDISTWMYYPRQHFLFLCHAINVPLVYVSTLHFLCVFYWSSQRPCMHGSFWHFLSNIVIHLSYIVSLNFTRFCCSVCTFRCCLIPIRSLKEIKIKKSLCYNILLSQKLFLCYFVFTFYDPCACTVWWLKCEHVCIILWFRKMAFHTDSCTKLGYVVFIFGIWKRETSKSLLQNEYNNVLMWSSYMLVGRDV